MEKHLGFLERRCRLCGKTFSRVKTIQKCDKTALQSELLNFFGVDIELDSREIHPQKVCSACRRIVYHLNSGNLDPETSEWRKQGIKLFVWKEHSSNCYCLQHQKGRRSKKELKKRKHDSDTESGKESESENEKDGCLTFNQLMDKLSKLDKELALTLSCKLTEYFNFLLVDLDNIDQSIASIQRGTLLQLTDSIFRLETEKVKKDILSCSQTYKSLPGLLQLRPDSWMEGRNEVLSHAVGALCHSGIKDVQKAVAVDQLCSLVQPSYVSPFLFGANLLVYSIARSKLAMNIYSKFFPAGGSSTVRAWLNRLTMDVQQMPSGDILTSIDNDQVLIKKWTVRKENRAQISILTSVCAAQIDQAGVEQRKKSLAPRYGGIHSSYCLLLISVVSVIMNHKSQKNCYCIFWFCSDY